MLKNDELLLWKRRQEEEKQELHNNDVHEDNDEEFPGDVVEELSKLPEKVQGDTVEKVRKMQAKKFYDTGGHESFDGCCYPECLFSFLPGGGRNLDTCQGDCNKMKRFHHA